MNFRYSILVFLAISIFFQIKILAASSMENNNQLSSKSVKTHSVADANQAEVDYYKNKVQLLEKTVIKQADQIKSLQILAVQYVIQPSSKEFSITPSIADNFKSNITAALNTPKSGISSRDPSENNHFIRSYQLYNQYEKEKIFEPLSVSSNFTVYSTLTKADAYDPYKDDLETKLAVLETFFRNFSANKYIFPAEWTRLVFHEFAHNNPLNITVTNLEQENISLKKKIEEDNINNQAQLSALEDRLNTAHNKEVEELKLQVQKLQKTFDLERKNLSEQFASDKKGLEEQLELLTSDYEKKLKVQENTLTQNHQEILTRELNKYELEIKNLAKDNQQKLKLLNDEKDALKAEHLEILSKAQTEHDDVVLQLQNILTKERESFELEIKNLAQTQQVTLEKLSKDYEAALQKKENEYNDSIDLLRKQ